MTAAPIPAPIAIAILLLVHAFADFGANDVRVDVNVLEQRCEISLTRTSTQPEYRKAQRECGLTGMPVVYLVR